MFASDMPPAQESVGAHAGPGARLVEAPAAQTSAAAGRGAEDFQVGLLGHGTVGSAFAALLQQRAEAVERLTGRRPALCGTLTRSSGDFEQILASSEAIVELIGGLEPAREYLLRALRAGRHVVTANKQLLSHHGEELFQAAREGGAQLRFEAAVAGVVPVIRVLSESLAGAHVQRVHGIVNGTTNFILTEMAAGSSYEQALAEAQRQGYAEADPSEDVSGRDAAAKMAILARLAFGTPVHIDQIPCEGIECLHRDDLQYARDFGLGLKLVGTAERRDGGLSVRVHPAFLYSGHPLASVGGPYNAVTVESEAITEITMSGPGAGGVQTASAVLGDLISAMRPAPTPAPSQPPAPLPLVQDVESGFYIHIELADRPGALAAVAQALGEQGASIRSVVQSGLGESARLVMVIHPLAESKLRKALELIGRLDFLRSTPRAIRVIEEEFN
jgi:homoserine dehydrogenase